MAFSSMDTRLSGTLDVRRCPCWDRDHGCTSIISGDV